jgi:hypothetical protein
VTATHLRGCLDSLLLTVAPATSSCHSMQVTYEACASCSMCITWSHHTYSSGSERCARPCLILRRTALVVNASQSGARGAEVLAAASAALAATSAALKADKALFDSSAAVRTLHDTGKHTQPCKCHTLTRGVHSTVSGRCSTVLRQRLLQTMLLQRKSCKLHTNQCWLQVQAMQPCVSSLVHTQLCPRLSASTGRRKPLRQAGSLTHGLIMAQHHALSSH